jgi:hypothetical protein
MALRKFTVGLIVCLFILGAVLSAAAELPDDGRINVGPYAGGTAIYCVDANNNVSGSFEDGGLKVLSHEGDLLLFAPGSELGPLVIQGHAGMLAENTLVASGPNAFGTGDLMLYVLTNGHFMLAGYDMHGSFFDFSWEGCDPIVPPADTSDEEIEPTAVGTPEIIPQ